MTGYSVQWTSDHRNVQMLPHVSSLSDYMSHDRSHERSDSTSFGRFFRSFMRNSCLVDRSDWSVGHCAGTTSEPPPFCPASEITCIAFSRLYRSSVGSVSQSRGLHGHQRMNHNQSDSAHGSGANQCPHTFFLKLLKHEASHGEAGDGRSRA